MRGGGLAANLHGFYVELLDVALTEGYDALGDSFADTGVISVVLCGGGKDKHV